MKLSEFKNTISKISKISFQLENGDLIPPHFHITEIGFINKRFIDCGGTIRNEKLINFQLWHAEDLQHVLNPKKVIDIITIAENSIFSEDLEVEVEYQNSTIGKYALDFNGNSFLLKSKTTNCLAEDQCGIEISKPKVSISDINKVDSNCSPGSGCC